MNHDPQGSFTGMDFRPARATVDDFAEKHVYLCTSPESGFVRICSVQRRDASGVDALTGCVLRRLGAVNGAPRVLDSRREWYEALADVFGLPLTDVDALGQGLRIPRGVVG